MRAFLVFALIAVSSVYCAPQSPPSGSLTDLIDSVFGNNKNGPGPAPGPAPGSGPAPGPGPAPGSGPDTFPQVSGCPAGSECVAHYLCKGSNVIRDGVGIIDIRFDGETPQQCANYLEECCQVTQTVSANVVLDYGLCRR